MTSGAGSRRSWKWIGRNSVTLSTNSAPRNADPARNRLGVWIRRGLVGGCPLQERTDQVPGRSYTTPRDLIARRPLITAEFLENERREQFANSFRVAFS